MSPSVDAASVRGRAALLPIVLSFIAFVGIGLPGGLLGVGWPSIRDTFGMSQRAFGVVLGAVAVGYLISSFGAGRLLGRFGVGTALTLSCLVLAGGLLGSAAAPAWWLFVGGALAIGVGSGAIDTGLNIYVATFHSVRTMNWLHAFFGVGATIGPAVMTGVLEGIDASWRWGYAIVGGAVILIMAGFAVTRDRWQVIGAHGAVPDADTARRERPTPFLATLRLLAAWLGIAFFLVHVGVEVIAGQWSYTLFTEERGISEATAGLWISLYWGSLTVGRVVLGSLIGLVRMERLLKACMVTVVLSGVAITLDFGPVADATGLALLGLGLAPIFPSLISTTPERMGPAHTGNGVGFQVGAAVLGGALIPGVVGVLADRVGLEVVGPALIVTAAAQLVIYLMILAQAKNAAARAPLPARPPDGNGGAKAEPESAGAMNSDNAIG